MEQPIKKEKVKIWTVSCIETTQADHFLNWCAEQDISYDSVLYWNNQTLVATFSNEDAAKITKGWIENENS